MQIDVLIVGQGLAGSLLAWTLWEHDFSFLIIDSGELNASQVAAGLINPVTGQRLVKSKEVDFLLPAAMACYQRLSQIFGQQVFTSMPMLRVLKNQREYEIACQRVSESNYQGFLRFFTESRIFGKVSVGLLEQQQTGYLNTRLLLAILRDFFAGKGLYRRVRLDYNDIALQPVLKWQDVEPRHIVFCEGHNAIGNPWFGRLPFQPAKGEILSCQSSSQMPAHILNFGHWLIPIDDHSFKLGATFEANYSDERSSEKARRTLLDSAVTCFPDLAPIAVQEQRAGIRPTTLDKQPFIGAHPRHSALHIFNGFGAKGSLQIPWYATRFVQSLRQQAIIPQNVHISRYYETHFAC